MNIEKSIMLKNIYKKYYSMEQNILQALMNDHFVHLFRKLKNIFPFLRFMT